MDKIRALIEQLGSKELADRIMESLDAYTKSVREEYDTEYKKRLQRAKQVCLEEVESYKNKLAQKTQIFLESRANTIERQIANQVAVKESAAETRLRKIATLLEGVETDGKEVNKAALRATMRQVRDLQKQLKVVAESRKTLEAKVSRANTIAKQAIGRSRILEEANKKLEAEKSKLLAESKRPAAKPKAPAKNGKRTNPINESKKAIARPKTTRPTLDSSVKGSQPSTPTRRMGGYTPEAIASQIEF